MLELKGLELYHNHNKIDKLNDPNKIFPLERVHLNHPCIENQTYKLLGIYFDKY